MLIDERFGGEEICIRERVTEIEDRMELLGRHDGQR
jgi:hypothetical protein